MYDFDSIIDRRSTDSFKWDVGENELPMWVADMDFHVLPEVRQAIEERNNLEKQFKDKLKEVFIIYEKLNI